MFQSLRDFSKTKAELQQKAKDIICESLREFMAAYPELKYFGWEQYAPYFNDGEPCTFHLQGFRIEPQDLNDESFTDPVARENVVKILAGVRRYNGNLAGEYDDNIFSDYQFNYNDRHHEEYANKFSTDLNDICGLLNDNDDMLEFAFGNDMTIKVSSSAIELSECGRHD